MTDETQTTATVSNAVQPSAMDTAAQLTVVAALASEPGPKVRDELEFRLAAAMEGASRRLPAFVLLMLVEVFELVERLPSEVLAGHIETFRKGYEAGSVGELLQAVEDYNKAVKAEAETTTTDAPPASEASAQQPGVPGGHWRG